MSNNLQILSNVEVHSKTGSKSKVSKNKVLNLGHLNFDIVSNFVLRISYFSCRDTLHASRNSALQLSRELYKSNLFLQNKAKLQNDQMNVTALLTKGSVNFRTFCQQKNEPKRTQNKAKFKNANMNVTPLLTKEYEHFRPFSRCKNKAKQSQNKANFSPKSASVSQNKPNSVKIGNFNRPTPSRSAFHFNSVFCVPRSVSSFVTNICLCFSPKFAVKWLKFIRKTLWLKES